MPLSELMTNLMVYKFCKYNPNGSFIATGDEIMYIWDIRANKAAALPVIDIDNEQFHKVTFHPNNVVLAILSLSSKRNGYYTMIRYWDILSRTLIKEMQPINGIASDLSFSPYGKEIIVTFNDKCIICPVPNEVINANFTCNM